MSGKFYVLQSCAFRVLLRRDHWAFAGKIRGISKPPCRRQRWTDLSTLIEQRSASDYPWRNPNSRYEREKVRYKIVQPCHLSFLYWVDREHLNPKRILVAEDSSVPWSDDADLLLCLQVLLEHQPDCIRCRNDIVRVESTMIRSA